MTTKKRRTGSRASSSRSPRARSSSSRSTSTRRRTLRRVSPASTIGTAVGVALAGLLVAMPGALPWWGWLLLVVVGLALLAVWAIRRRHAAEAAPSPEAGSDPAGTNGTFGPT